jgi:hypothetical protein
MHLACLERVHKAHRAFDAASQTIDLPNLQITSRYRIVASSRSGGCLTTAQGASAYLIKKFRKLYTRRFGGLRQEARSGHSGQ